MLQRQNIDQEGREVLATHKIVMLYVDLVGSHILTGRDLFSVNQEKDSTESISGPYSPLCAFLYQSWLRERVFSIFYFYCNLSNCSPITETFASARSSLIVKGKVLPLEGKKDARIK